MVANTKKIFFSDIHSELGHLTAIESQGDIPFKIKRVYYIWKVPKKVIRGYHSHYQLEQVLLCVNGSVKIRIKTPYEEEIVLLDKPNEGLYIGHMVWREMFDFTPGSVLLVLASEHYSEADYIRSYDGYENAARIFFEEDRA